jgi:hypothetical protein
VAEVEPVESRDAFPTSQQPVRLTGKDAFWLHFTLTAGLVVCCGAFAFELARALGGHTFSWMYVFEWPLFAGFAVYMWWNLLQGNDRVRRPSGEASGTGPAPVDEELEAWTRYVRRVESDGEPDMAPPGLVQTRPSARSKDADTPPSFP